jgi:PAS domain S-box-containing protein
LANHTALLAKDDREIPIEDSAAPVRGGEGEVVGVVLVFRDASERRRAEEASRRHQEILRLVHRIGKIGHWAWNSLTDENKWSPEIEALYGLEPGTFGGTYDAWAKLLHPDDLAKAQDDVRRALETGKYFTEFRVIWPDGSVHWLEARADVLKDGHDKPVRIIAVNMDVTERKQAEESLRQGERQLAAELEATSRLHALSARLLSATNLVVALEDTLENAIATVAADFGNMQLYNAQTGALGIVAQRGFREDFLVHFRTVRMDDSSACARAMLSGERVIVEDVLLDPEFEPHRQIAAAAGFRAVQSTPVRTRDGRVLGMLSTHFREPHRVSNRDQRLLDLYARHAADLIERIRSEEALKEADRHKDEFLALLGHELRNPLAPIRNAVNVLRLQCTGDPTVARLLPLMERQLTTLVRLVDDLLDVSRISRGKIELRKETVDLAILAARAVEAARPLLDKHEHHFEVDVPDGPVWAEADSARVEQVLSNLLSNAARYTPAGGQVRLSLARDAKEAVFRVRDSGIGIKPDDLAAVWETFRQAGRVEGRVSEGLGLGLTLVRRLTELHGGTVAVSSGGSDKGSEFTIRLPLLPEGVEPPLGAEPLQASAAPARGLRVLVVDDNKDAAESLAVVLQLDGHQTRTAGDGPQALAAAREFLPEAVFLDIGLPGKMDGYEVARRLRQEPGVERALLVAVTGYGTPEDVARARQARFDHHITKPADPLLVQRLLAERIAGSSRG